MSEVVTEADQVAQNPFQYGLPVTPEQFVGRWPLVSTIAGVLVAGGTSHACIGGRRIGKTSLLYALRHNLDLLKNSQNRHLVVTVFIDPMIFQFKSVEDFFGTLHDEIIEICKNRYPGELGSLEPSHVFPSSANCKGAPLSAIQFARDINCLFEHLERNGGPRRITILLDEMDHLLDYPWHKVLFAQLRGILVSREYGSRLSLVFAGSQRFLDEATDRGSPLWNMLRLHYLTSLDEAHIDQLVDRAKDVPLPVRTAVQKMSGGHPFIAQYFLHELWSKGVTHSTEADVKELATCFTQQQSSHLDGWSRAIGLAGLQVYGLFVQQPVWPTLASIYKAVDDPSVPVRQALISLCYHGLIIPGAGWSQYRRAGDLFREWYIQETARLKHELGPQGTKAGSALGQTAARVKLQPKSAGLRDRHSSPSSSVRTRKSISVDDRKFHLKKTPPGASPISRHPAAFLSYARFDDRHEKGRITQFRERLSGEVRMQSGGEFEIFQDHNDIAWGEPWKQRIDESLDAVTFLIPILTPGFFNSAPCRDEFERFLDREQKLGSNDLILPVYWVDCPILGDETKLESDVVVRTIHGRQYADWRPLRFKSHNSPQFGRTFASLAYQILQSIGRAPSRKVVSNRRG
jgi:hypothetical protein